MRSFLFIICLLSVLQVHVRAISIKLPGKVINPKDSTVTLVVFASQLGEKPKVHNIKLTERNAFQFEIDIEKPIFVEFRHARIRFPVFLNPEKAVSISLDVKSNLQGNVTFRGPGKADNTFYLQYFNFTATKLINKKIDDIRRSRAKEFVTFVKSRESQQFDFIKNYLEKNDVELSPALQIWLRNDIKYQSAELLLKYPYLYNLAHKGLRTKELPKKYYKFLESVRINNDQAIHQPNYRSFLEGYFFNYRLETAKDWQYLTSYDRQYEYVERFFVGKAKYYLQSVILKDGISNNPEFVEEEYFQFLEGKAPIKLKQNIRAQFTGATREVRGLPFDTEALLHTNGQTPAAGYFKNKITYVFFWSFRTPNSRFEMRYVRALAKKFERENKVRIVLINLDSNTGQWKSFIQNDPHRFQGLNIRHLQLNSNNSAAYLNKYRIEGPPEFFLIDHLGQIVSDNTWSPSSGGAPRMIRRLLEETTK